MKKLLALFLLPLACFANITSQTEKTGPFVITGLPQTIPVGFPFQQGSDLVVLDTGLSNSHDPALVLVLGSDYTVTGGGYNGANQMQVGSVVVVTGGVNNVQVNDNLVILRGVPINQPTSFTSTGPLTISLLEQALDREATLSQQIDETTSRSLRFEKSEFGSPVLNKASRANTVLGFDGNSNISYIAFTTIPSGAITGTAHQINVSTSGGLATLSTPQNIDTSSSPQFASAGFGLPAQTNVLVNIAYSGATVQLPVNDIDPVETQLHFTQKNAVPLVELWDSFASNGALIFRRANGTSAAPTALLSNQLIGHIEGTGYGATGYTTLTAPRMDFVTSENWSDTALGSEIRFLTTMNTTATSNLVLTLGNDASANFTGVVKIKPAASTEPTVISGAVIHATQLDATVAVAQFDTFGANTSFIIRRANGTSAAPSAILTTQLMGEYGFGGYGANAYNANETASIQAVSSENWTNSANGTDLKLRTTPNGSTSSAIVLTVAHDGTITSTSSITTGAPAGGTAAAWKHGVVHVVNPTNPNRTIELDVNGTIYYLSAKTTDD